MPRIFNKEILPGTISSFGGGTVPNGWLLCDASAVSRTVYAKLFAAIGTTYGVGDGVTTFNLPDGRGIFLRGAGTNGTTNYGGASGHTPAGGSLGNKGRQFTAKNGLTGTALSGVNLSHTHSHNAERWWGSYGTNAYQSPPQGMDVRVGLDHAVINSSGPLDHSHSLSLSGDSETTPAFLAIHFIIKI